jgi:uncharacterized protein (DUF58 family)
LSSATASDRVGIAGTKAGAAAIAQRLPPLLLAAERIAATLEQGVHGRRRTGAGEVFWQYRLYYPGDELKQLDWRASAKSDRLYLRQQEWSAAQSAFLWADLSPSMQYRSKRSLPTKAERTQVLLLALAIVLAKAGERIGLIGRAEPPISGRSAHERLAEQLAHLAQAPEAAPSLPPEVQLPAHAHVILVGDFLVPVETLKARVAVMANRGIKGHLLQILDPAEMEMPFTGRVRFLGLEQEGRMLVSRTETIRRQYLDRLAEHRASLADLTRAAGWSITLHRTDQAPAPALLALYQWLAADRRFRR